MQATAAASNTVVTFWHGRPLSHLRKICLASQVKTGYAVKLYSYEPIQDLPLGVENVDAAPILSSHYLDKLSIVQFSDFFRVRLQENRLGIWLDNDLYLLRPMQVDPSIPYFGLVSRGHINNAVLYLPPAHPIVAAYELALGQLEVLPDSLPAYYKLTQFFRKLAGKPSMPWQLRHAMYGPRMLTGLARRTDTLKYALPIRSFHAVHWKPELFFEKRNFAPLVEDPQVLGLHISPGIWERKSVVAGSLCEWAGRNVGMPA